MFSVGNLAKVWHVATDAIDHQFTLLIVNDINHGLDDVVRELVLDHCDKRAVGVIILAQHLFKQGGAILTVRVCKTLLDDVGGELVLGQRQQGAAQRLHDRTLVPGSPVDQHVLDDVVSILILAQLMRVVQNLREDGIPLFFGAMF